MKTIEEEINRLNFEDWLFIIVIILTILNIYGDQIQKQYIKTNNKDYLTKSTCIFLFVLIVSSFIYLYFVKRNYNIYKNASPNEKKVLSIKLLGSVLLYIGILLLIYFQIKDSNFIGAPAE